MLSQLEMQSVEVVAVYGETKIHEWGTNTNTSALNIKECGFYRCHSAFDG